MEGAKQSFRDQIPMEGTNATGALPNRQQTSATPSPKATYTPSTKTTVPFGKTIVSQLDYMPNWMDLEICHRWRGRVQLEPCQIGSTRPRRQARGRRSLHPFKSIQFDLLHSLTMFNDCKRLYPGNWRREGPLQSSTGVFAVGARAFWS